jgi:hypothetical protein
VKYFLCILALLAFVGLSVRVAEGAEETFTSSTWVAGTGPRAQIWILNVRGNAISGAVCGPCDDPRSLAPLVDGKVIDANHIVFFILHDLQGGLFAQYGPYRNEARVTFSGETGDFTSHLENEPWTSHPVHQNWKLVSKQSDPAKK